VLKLKLNNQTTKFKWSICFI